jgi:hypothetical protein
MRGLLDHMRSSLIPAVLLCLVTMGFFGPTPQTITHREFFL